MDHIKSLISDFPESTSTRIPSCKSINEPVAGLYIALDNMIIAGWNEEEMTMGEDYFIKTDKEDPITKKFVQIPGRLFTKPKLLILRCSPFLKMDAVTRFVTGIWNAKEDAYLKEQRLAFCVKRYLLFFLNDDYKKMHVKPIQLTARGNFMFKFDVMFNEFCMYMFNVKEMARQKLYLSRDGNDKDCFFASNFVFEPEFQSQIVGAAGKKSNACITVGYKKDEIVFKADEQHKQDFISASGWYKAAYQRNVKEQSPIVNEDVVYEECDL